MNALYDISASKMLKGQFNWLTADLMLIAWDGPPTFDPTDETVAAVKAHPGITELAVSLPIIGRTVTSAGIAKTDNVIIPGIAMGEIVSWFTLCVRDAVHDDSEMVMFLDEVEGLPFNPNGLDLAVQPDWAQGRGWFKLG